MSPAQPANGATNPAATPRRPPTPAGTERRLRRVRANAQSRRELQPNLERANPMVSTYTSESDGQHSESRDVRGKQDAAAHRRSAGRMQKIAAAVLVDDVVEEKKDAKGKDRRPGASARPEEMKQIEDLAKAAMGFDATRGDVLSVQNVSFVNAPERETLEPPPVVERVRMFAEKWVWLARYVMLFVLFLLIYVLILRPVKKRLVSPLSMQANRRPH